MNSKKGGSLASNHVHRLLKGDCKKGGKRSRAKKSKSKSKKSKRRTKKPKLVKRKKRTRNKKTKKKMKGGGGWFSSLFSSSPLDEPKSPKLPKCNGEEINIENLDDLITQKESLITCPEELILYLEEEEKKTNKIFTDADDYQKLESLMDFFFIAGVCYSLIFIDMNEFSKKPENELYKEYIKYQYNGLKELINAKRNEILTKDYKSKEHAEKHVFGNHAIIILLYILPKIVFGSKKEEIKDKYAQYCEKYYEALLPKFKALLSKMKGSKIAKYYDKPGELEAFYVHEDFFNKIKERFIETNIITEE